MRSELKCTREIIYAQGMQPSIGTQSTEAAGEGQPVLQLQTQVTCFRLEPMSNHCPELQRTENLLILLFSLRLRRRSFSNAQADHAA